MEFIKAFYTLKCSELLTTGCSLSGSPHVHGLAWLPDTPDVEQVHVDTNDDLKEEIIKHADQLVSTINPAVLPDGSNITNAPTLRVNPHICNKMYRILMRTWLILLPPASDTPDAQLPTVCARRMSSKSVSLDTPSPYKPTQLLSQKMS